MLAVEHRPSRPKRLMTIVYRSRHEARDAALYIETLTRELKRLAHSPDLEFLAYLLAMASEEARAVGRKLGDDLEANRRSAPG